MISDHLMLSMESVDTRFMAINTATISKLHNKMTLRSVRDGWNEAKQRQQEKRERIDSLSASA